MWEQVFAAVFLIYALVCLVFLNFFHHITAKRSKEYCNNAQKVLFVIAHPDDECMFFGPSIISLCQQKIQVYLLCLSTGNYYGIGKTRKQELAESCRILGIDSSNIMIINHTKLPDDNGAFWNRNLVAKIILRHVISWDINTIITFGKQGVSGHRNHCAIYKAINSLSNKELPAGCNIFTLKDVSLIRKYLGVLDVPLTLLFSPFLHVSSYKHVRACKLAMAAHQSQMVWFRKLYLFFSRYIVVNDFQLLFSEEKSKDI